MPKLPEHLITLRFSYQTEITSLLKDPDDSNLVDFVSCEIIYLSMEERKAEPITIGSMHLYHFNFGTAINLGLNRFEAMEGITELARILFDEETDELKEAIIDQIDFTMNHDILVVDEFVIYPEYRGMGIGEEVLKGFLRHYDSKAGYIALKSFPLQFMSKESDSDLYGDKLRLSELEADRKKAQKSLNAFFKRCGLKPIKKHPNFFIKNTDLI